MIDLMSLTISPTRTRIAELLVRYHDLVLICELVLYLKGPHLWVRMPETWDKNIKKFYCTWPNLGKSEEFQKTILNKVFEKYGLDVTACQKILADSGVLKRKKLDKIKTNTYVVNKKKHLPQPKLGERV